MPGVRSPNSEENRSLTLPLAKGTNPIHNKKQKKNKAEYYEDTKSFNANQQAGKFTYHHLKPALIVPIDKKAREELMKTAGKKGPMNTGQQGIKKSGKK